MKRRAKTLGKRKEKAGKIEKQGIKGPDVDLEVKPRTGKQMLRCSYCEFTTTKTSRLERHQKREKRELDKKISRKFRGDRKIVKHCQRHNGPRVQHLKLELSRQQNKRPLALVKNLANM